MSVYGHSSWPCTPAIEKWLFISSCNKRDLLENSSVTLWPSRSSASFHRDAVGIATWFQIRPWIPKSGLYFHQLFNKQNIYVIHTKMSESRNKIFDVMCLADGLLYGVMPSSVFPLYVLHDQFWPGTTAALTMMQTVECNIYNAQSIYLEILCSILVIEFSI